MTFITREREGEREGGRERERSRERGRGRDKENRGRVEWLWNLRWVLNMTKAKAGEREIRTWEIQGHRKKCHRE